LEETDSTTLYLAIDEFRRRYGDTTPLDSRVEDIIREIKESK